MSLSLLKSVHTRRAKILIPCIVLAAICLASGQGFVQFNNRVVGTVVSHVWYGCADPSRQGNSSIDYPPGTNNYDGYILVGAAGVSGQGGAATTLAALLGAPGSNAADGLLIAGDLGGGATATSFRTGGAAGNIVAANAVFSNIPLDAPVATFRMFVWDNSSGLYPNYSAARAAWQSGFIAAGQSSKFVVTNIGGIVNFAPPLVGLTSFNFGPLPACPPFFVIHPTNQAGAVSGAATFAAQAFSWTSATNYQWYFNGSPIAGATNRILSLHNLQSANFGSYFAGVQDIYDWAIYSHTAQLTVAASPQLKAVKSGSSLNLSFPTEIGPGYVLEFKTNIEQPDWLPLATNLGNGRNVTISQDPTISSSRFYRVRLF
jgi:hypothetical protein